MSKLGFANFQVQGVTGKGTIKAHKSLLIFRYKSITEQSRKSVSASINQYQSIHVLVFLHINEKHPNKTSELSTREEKASAKLMLCSTTLCWLPTQHSPTAVWVGLCSEEHRLQSTVKAFYIFLLSLYLPLM